MRFRDHAAHILFHTLWVSALIWAAIYRLDH
jgi:hypothetical protein